MDRPVAAAFALLAALGTAPPAGSQGLPPEAAPPRAGRLSLLLEGRSLRARASSGSPGEGYLGLSLSADDGGAELRGGLRLEGGEGESSFLAAGPGGASGFLRLLADPASFSPLSPRGGPVSLDGSLASGRAVLGAGAGRVAAFALAEGAGAGFLFGYPEGEEAGQGSPPRAAAAGLCLADGAWSAAAALSLRRGSEGSGGWEPERPPELPGLVAHGGLARERIGESGRALFGLAASWGELEGPALAARLEAEAREGPFWCRLSTASVGAGFRELSGSRPDRSLAAAADLRLALKRAASLGLALRLESPSSRPGAAPAFGSSAGLRLSLPLDRAGGPLILEPRAAMARKPGGRAGAELGLGLRRIRGEEGSSRLELCFGLGGEGGAGAAELLFASSVRRPSGLGVELELAFSASGLGGGSAPVLAEPELRLVLPLPREAELRIEAAGPEGGFELAPLAAEARAPGFELSLRYLLAL